MKLSHGLGLTGLGLFGAVLAVTSMTTSVGCSGGSSGSSSGGGSGDTCANTANKCIVQPAAPTTGSPTSASHNYAIKSLYLGDTDRTGVASSEAWKAYGYNLDNLVTTKSSTDVCTLAAGASKTTQADGNGGIDNSFGENILPIVITTAGSGAAAAINTAITEGHFTIMTYVTGFDDSANNTTSATGLTGLLLAGGNYADAHDGGAPTWDMSTHWPIVPTIMNGCDPTNGCGTGCTYGSSAGACGVDPIKAATITFPQAYQAGGTFVNGSPASLSLNLSIGGQSLSITVHSALITFQPKSAGSVTDGTIAGVLITDELVQALKSVAGNISTSLCSGSAFDSIASQIDQASDIVIDTNSGAVSNTSGPMCNGISIGLGFEGTEIAA
ncbi:MAG TPA: hypothetical protein VIJ20_08510, partial [Solirubrobacteraceae bacterium]